MSAPSSDLTPQGAALHEVRARFERGTIDYDAFRAAFEAVLATTDPAAYARIVAELPDDPLSVLDSLDRSRAATPPAIRQPRLPRRRTFFTLMGEIRRTRRPWKMGEHTTGVALMGSIDLDLTLAALPRNGTLRVALLMGEVQITVPPNVTVAVHAFTFMGAAHALGETAEGIFAYAHDEVEATEGGAPHELNIHIFTLMGEVRVRRSDVPAIIAKG
ncbi:MAG: hypothetical protein H0X24_19055 [Ktedonobacterales bacterium]|nr:hypothetical protein [Ktedonobacterales bacterium]